MNKAEIMLALAGHQTRLRALGVMHAAVFGSFARGTSEVDSDIDVLVDLAPARRTVFDLVGIEQAVAEILPGKVHVAIFDQLKPALRASVMADAAFAF